MREGCKEHFENMSEYLDGTLDQELCGKIEAHLNSCPECRRCLDSLKKVIRLCRQGSEEEVPRDLGERIKAKLRECVEGPPKTNFEP